jgi:hypothetical protein
MHFSDRMGVSMIPQHLWQSVNCYNTTLTMYFSNPGNAPSYEADDNTMLVYCIQLSTSLSRKGKYVSYKRKSYTIILWDTPLGDR